MTFYWLKLLVIVNEAPCGDDRVRFRKKYFSPYDVYLQLFFDMLMFSGETLRCQDTQ